jgi:hypothetical protein
LGIGWEESPLSSTTPHFFPPKKKTVNVKKEKERNFWWISPRCQCHPKRDPESLVRTAPDFISQQY